MGNGSDQPNQPAAASLRADLRARTGPLHQQAEGALALMDPAMSKERYRAVLSVLHAFYAELEPAIAAHASGWARLGIDMPARRKLHLLEADLASLGARVEKAGAAASLPTFPDAVGAAYVVEGATLGGAVIHRHLSTALGFGEGPGARFFDAYGEETGPRWKEFAAALDKTGFDAADRERAVASAVRTFARLLSLARQAL